MPTFLTSEDELLALYGTPRPASTVKVARHLTPEYRAWIEAAPFCALATVGPKGTDCSPRGDDGAVVQIVDDTTLALPDRRGNDRIDTLRNIIRDPRLSLMFLVPGSATVIRVNGTGRIAADPGTLERFAIHGKAPRSVLFIEIGEIYFQCARAVLRAGLWTGQEAPDLPTPGDILASMTEGEVGGPSYDAAWPDRARKTMW
ncbi:pyridoxamine 5'-phosphate oxidase family protein [Aestuariibius insulae]|uniref:pyridoxamine 5'-phosphate oxidase family protein n=1 Tax=Aestuariibius insulae TaxID=2058287 RepID=UPI00345EDE17